MNEDTKKKVLFYLQQNLVDLLKIADVNKKVCLYENLDSDIKHIIKNNDEPMKTVAQSEYGSNLYGAVKEFIYTHKKKEVKKFLLGFGVSESEADKMISEIGIYPIET